MGRRLVRLTRDLVRVVKIDGQSMVLTIGTHGLTLRQLKSRKSTAVPLTWKDLSRECGMLDSQELSFRPLLAECVRRNCIGGRHS
jgi:hypothetical protein